MFYLNLKKYSRINSAVFFNGVIDDFEAEQRNVKDY